MGNIIRKDASPSAILSYLRTTLANAALKGGKIKEVCEGQLLGVLAMANAAESEHHAAETALVPLNAAVRILNDDTDEVLGRIYDETWNDVGRPQYDTALSLIFPGGSSYYAEGDTYEQPLRMELLAKLFERGLHPRLSTAQAQARAAAVRAAALPLAQAVEAARVPAATERLAAKVLAAVAKSVHAELVNTKRLLKVAGFGEPEIHEVMPDIGPAAPKKKEGGGEGGSGTGEK